MATESVVEIVLRVRNEIRDTIVRLQKQIEDLNTSFGGLASDKVVGGLDDSAAALNNVSKAAGAADKELVQAAEGSEKFAFSLNGTVVRVRGLIQGLLGLAAVQIGAKLAREAGRAEVLGTVLNVVGTNAGFTTDKLREMDKAVQAMGITTQASRQSLTLLIQSQLVSAQNMQKAAQLARAAQDLAVVTGQNSSDTFQRLVLNIQQLDTVGLRWMGLMVDRNRAEKEFAAALGKTSTSLSLVEKRQAFLNAAMVEARKLSGTYEASMTNVQKQIQSLVRYEQELQVAVGNAFLPAQLALVKEYTELLKDLGKEFDNFGRDPLFAALTEGFATVIADIRKLLVALASAKDLVVLFILAWGGAKFFAWIKKMLVDMVNIDLTLTATVPKAKSFANDMERAARAVASMSAARIGGVVPPPGSGPVPGQPAPAGQATRNTADVKEALFNAAVFGMAAKNAEKVGFLSKSLQFLKNTFGAAATAGRGLAAVFSTLTGPIFALWAAFEAGRFIYASWQKLTEKKDTRTSLSDEETAAAERILTKQEELAQRRIKNETLLATLQSKKDLTATDKANIKELEGIIEGVAAAEKAAVKEFDKMADAIDNPDRAQAFRDYRFNRKVDINIDEKNFQEKVDALTKNREDLGLTKIKITPDFVVSEDFYKKVDAAQNVLAEFLNPSVSPEDSLTGKVKQTDAALQEVTETLKVLVKSGSSTSELTLALGEIDKAAAETKQDYSALRDEAQKKFDTAATQELATATARISDQLKTLGGIYESQYSIVKDTADVNRDLASTLVGIDSDATSASIGFKNLSLAYGGFVDKSGELQDLKLDGLQKSAEQATQTYQKDLATLRAVVTRKKEIVKQDVQTYSEEYAKLQAVDKENAAERYKITKDYYDKLRGLQKQALDDFKTYAEKVKALDLEIFSLRERKEIDIREMRRSTLSQEEQLVDVRREIEELASQARLASLQNEFERAATLNERRLELAKRIASFDEGGDKEDLQREATVKTTEAYNALIANKERERAITAETAQKQYETFQEFSKQIDQITTKLQAIASEQVTQITLEVNQPSVNRAIDQIQDAFSNLEIRVKVIPFAVANANLIEQRWRGGEIKVPKKAEGGLLSGPGTGTSDSILAWLSNGEYVVRAQAVQNYGASFLSAINNMRVDKEVLPKYAEGGLVDSPAPVTTTSSRRDVVDVNLNVSGKKVSLMGERDQVRTLVSALKGLEVAR